MNVSLRSRLSILMFLQFFTWGSWYVTAGSYLLHTLEFTGKEVGLIYSTPAISATISPFIVGFIADRYFPIEKLLSLLQISGSVLLVVLSFITSFNVFFWIILLYMIIFLPAFTLTNSLCLQHLKDTKAEFPKIRVWGTIAWICAGLLVGMLRIETQVTPFRIAAGVSVLLAVYSLTMIPGKPLMNKSIPLTKILFGQELKELIHDRGFIILMLSLALICIPAAYYYSFVNAFLNDIKVDNAAGKMALGQITEIIILLALPTLFRIMKLRYIIFLGLFCWGLRYALLYFGIIWDNSLFYLIAIALHGPSYVFAILTAQIILDIKVPKDLRSTAQGFFSLITLGLGAFVGTYLAGTTVSMYTNMDSVIVWEKVWIIPAVLGCVVSLFFVFNFKGLEIDHPNSNA